MRLAGIQQFLKERHLPFQYWEEDDCGSIEFDHRGLHYHIWEFPEPERGAQSNVASQVVVRSLATITKKRF